MRVLFRTGGMLSFNLSAEGFNRHLIAIIKGQDCLAFAASHIVGLRLLEGWGHPPDNPVVSCPAGYAHGDHCVKKPRPQHAYYAWVSRSPGKELFMSASLMSRLSTSPPLNPDSRLTVVLIKRDMTTIMAGMSRESRAPKDNP